MKTRKTRHIKDWREEFKDRCKAAYIAGTENKDCPPNASIGEWEAWNMGLQSYPHQNPVDAFNQYFDNTYKD